MMTPYFNSEKGAIVRLVPLWDVEEDILEPIVRRILVLARLVLVLSENL